MTSNGYARQNTIVSRAGRRTVNRLWSVTALFAIGALFLISCWLAKHRIYQVDECQNVYVAQLLASGRAASSFTSVSVYLAPLVWIGRGVTSSVDLYAGARYFALVVFWINVVLLAVATGERLWSRRGLVAFVGAATLAPLWDYGFEIRHDNLLLTGLLMMWCVLRVFPCGVPSYVAAGALAVGLEFVALKAFVYTLPLSLVSLAWPSPTHRTSRARLASAWFTGALLTLLMLRIAYGIAGWWDLYVRDFRGMSETAVNAARFGPAPTLARLGAQAPLLIAAIPAALISLKEGSRRFGLPVLTWSGLLPEALLLFLALIALSINPAPYPYNLVNVVPFGFLLAFRLLSSLSRQFSSCLEIVTAGWIVVAVVQMVPFVVATQRHVGMKNDRQKVLMQSAEDLTDSTSDAVYDGIGLVPTRRSVSYHWYLHSLYIDRFRGSPDLRLQTMLSSIPAAVIIPNYRTDWLLPDDHAFIRSRYVPLSDDFWLLGAVVGPGGGTVRIVHAGRYRLVKMKAQTNTGTSVQAALLDDRALSASRPKTPLTIDGKTVMETVVELATGAHEITCPMSCRPALVWLGPRLAELPLIGEGDHRSLFVSWY